MSATTLDITILGSGTSTGVPVIGCDCDVCTSNDPHNKRTRCSALLSYAGHNLLIDTATDLRQQALREGIRQIDAVLYTHSHADHMHGIDDLRSFNFRHRGSIPLYGSPRTLERVRDNFDYIFANLEKPGYVPRLSLHPIEDDFYLFEQKIEPIALEHGGMQVYGYRCGPFAYLTDCNGIPEASLLKLSGLKLLVLDGLRFKPHDTHFNISQAIEMAKRIGAERTLLTHLSHDIDHRRDSKTLPAGIEFAYDGFSCSLPLSPEARK
ncbi:phosphoribosyl 1,2-cyclic phosphate phosphodiesterase [Malonomonas rubra DSM 5091]|uniref:Phosphoribosyl 1,2-cyclic phosphate phosphodiesterase n=1 Tax=Malonomonas rubra DSM 5091 TaxID=1122189 RepID=A0A1M6FC28_MALRU|nr:GPMC system MBL fold metallohydrolase [Malonomonas rubra]SHI95196.1 phosphoribosyl 1,2-cyclic phosphate phosphodiesterase [Malonomonas rubra DSM 5091]